MLLFVVHALFGREQNGCADDQQTAQHIEDRSADAAGGGQDSAGLVGNALCHGQATCISDCRISAVHFYFHGILQQVVACGSDNFFEVVGAVRQTVKGSSAVLVCGLNGSLGLVRIPLDFFVRIVPLVVLLRCSVVIQLIQDKLCAGQLLAGIRDIGSILVDHDLGAVDGFFFRRCCARPWRRPFRSQRRNM